MQKIYDYNKECLVDNLGFCCQDDFNQTWKIFDNKQEANKYCSRKLGKNGMPWLHVAYYATDNKCMQESKNLVTQQKIEQLSYTFGGDRKEPPTREQITDKLNEIINILNEIILEKE